MTVFDANFALDYEDGIEATKEYLLAHSDERFLVPAPTLLKVLIGDVHYEGAATDPLAARENLSFVDEIHSVTERTVMHAAHVADEIGPQGPQLTMPDAAVAGTSRELDVPVVSHDSDLTHEATKRVLAVEEYR